MKTSLLAAALLGLAGLSLASRSEAIPLTFGDVYSIGSIEKGTPDSDSDQVAFLNTLLDLAAGNDQVVGVKKYDRTSNFQPGTGYPDAVTTGAIRDGNEADPSISLGGGFLYALAKYGSKKVPGTSDNAFYVWYVGGLTGDLTLPSKGLSHISLYNPSTRSVPDGGLTVMLLGVSLAGLAAFRRFAQR